MRRRTIGVAAAAVVLLAAGGFAATRFLRPAGPRSALVVDPDPLEFPTARWGERLQRSFTLKNRSDRAVLVRDPRFSCGCFRLVRPAPFATLQPGDVFTFEVVMESAASGSPGLVRKEMTIESDDPVTPKLVVPIVGHLTAFRTIDPSSLALGTVDPAGDGAETVEKKVAVRAGQGFTVEVVKAEADDRQRLTTEVRSAEGGSDVVVRPAKGAPAGPIASAVRLTLAVREKDGAPETVVDSVWVTGRVR
jgi:hypothetical protein